MILQTPIPPPPLNLQVEISNGTVILTWDAPTSNAESVTGYEILRKRPTKGEKKFKTYVNNTNSTNTTYADLNATEAGVQYVYRVKALRNDGTKSKKSNNAKITLSSSFYKPQNLEVNITNGAVTLYWDAPRMDAESVTGYEILRKRPTKGEKKLKTYVNNTNSTNTTYTDLNATEAEVRYAYRVKALRNDGTKSKRSNFAKIDLNETLTPLQGYVLNTTVVIVEEPQTQSEPEPTLHAQAAHSTPGLGTKASVSESVEVLLSNLGRSTDVTAGLGAIETAQGFTTGSNAYGYHLDSIAIRFDRNPGNKAKMTVALWSATNGSTPKPKNSIATLTHSTGNWSGVNTFNAPGTDLKANTTYFLRLSYSGSSSGDPALKLTTSGSVDGEQGWDVTGPRLYRNRLSTQDWDVSSPQYVKFEIKGMPVAECGLDDEWDSSIPRPSNVRVTPYMNGRVKVTWNHPTANGYSDNKYVVSHRRLWTMNGPPMGNEGKYGWQEAGTTDWANFTRVVNDNQITIDINATPGEQHAIRVHSVEEIRGAKNACSRPKTRNFWAAKQNENDPDAVTMIQNPFITEEFVFDANGNARRESRVRIEFKPVEGLQNYEMWRAGPDNTFTQVAGGSRCVELVEQGLEDGEEYVQHCKNRIHETLSFLLDLSSVDGIVFYEPVGSMKSGKTYSYILFPIKDNVTHYGGRWDIRHTTIP